MNRRNRIRRVVEQHPGISFSALREKTGLANGVLQHHLRRMEDIEQKRGAVVPRYFCRDCPLQQPCSDTCLLKLIRDSTKRTVVNGLLEGETQSAIADTLGLHRSTVSYHVKQLEERGVLDGKQPVEAVQELLEENSIIEQEDRRTHLLPTI